MTQNLQTNSIEGKSMKYYFSEREDSVNYQGPFNSIKEALEACKADDSELDVCWIGEEEEYLINPGGFGILENIAEDLDCEGYEDADDTWLQNSENTNELDDELDEVIRNFLKSKGMPVSITIIKNQRSYQLRD